MRVAEVTRFGGPEVLETKEVPDPVAGPGQAVIGVEAADTIVLETLLRQGWGQEFFDVRPPYVPGGAVTGTVLAVGEGVGRGWIGRRVGAHTGTSGGYAEQALVPEESLVPLPEELGTRQAAALLHDGPTAVTLFGNAAVRAGEWVLVLAAAGGAASVLVQLAHAAGAQVVGAARGKQKLDAVRELGADVTVDYSVPGWIERVREATGGHGADVVFDGAGGELGTAALEVAARGARFASYGAPGGEFATLDPAAAERRGIALSGIDQVQFAPDELKRMTERAFAEAAAGRIRPLIGQTLPLRQAARAHAAIEARAVIGKTLLVSSPAEPAG